jgi:hypothetical protein
MDQFTFDDLKNLIADRQGPHVSVYTKTTRGGGAQDVIRWKHQLDDAQHRLAALGMSRGQAMEFVLTPRVFLKRSDFWKDTGDGLATFLAPDFFRAYRLPLAFDDAVFIGSRFHIKPVLSWFTGEGKFHVLALSQKHARLFEGNAHRLHFVAELSNMEQALAAHDRDEVLNLHTRVGAGGTGMQAVFHGQGVGIDDHKEDLVRYFRQVDREVNEHVGAQSPLLLATVSYLAPIYRKASKHPHLLDTSIHGNADHLNEGEIHARALSIVAPHLQERKDKALAEFRRLARSARASTDLAALLPAAQRGELQCLLLPPGRAVWGRYDESTGSVTEHPQPAADDEELTNLAATFMLRRGRNVYNVPDDTVFDGVAAAGIFFAPVAPDNNAAAS